MKQREFNQLKIDDMVSTIHKGNIIDAKILSLYDGGNCKKMAILELPKNQKILRHMYNMFIKKENDKIEKIKDYRKLDLIWEKTLSECVLMLIEHASKGELVCYEFNGTMLYSDTVSMDSAFLEITGKTFFDYLNL